MVVEKTLITIKNIKINTTITEQNPIKKYTIAINGKIVKTLESEEELANILTQELEINTTDDNEKTINVTALNEKGEAVGSMTKKYFPIVVNPPDIDGFNKENTYYVEWNLNEERTEYIPNEVNMKEVEENKKDIPDNWYNYTAGQNRMANIKTTGGNDCYWVWIPRYAYCITEGYHSGAAGTIDIKFLQGTTNIPTDGSNIEIKNQTGSGNWNVHPAFWFDKNNNGVEDDGEQLTGIWVAKFEASSNSSGVVENPTAVQLAIDGGSDIDTDLKIRVRPNVTSWRNITVGNIFTVCRNLTTTGNSLENTNNIDSHMMRNTEWGAVAYLSRSVYGKNGEVWNNPYYSDPSYLSPITGLCGKEADDKDLAITDINRTFKYNEVGGGNASTTGNVYGIYDISGGSLEYVAGINEGGETADIRGEVWDEDNSKYVNKYEAIVDSQGGYFGNTGKYGDAVFETSIAGSGSGAWDFGYSFFPFPASPVFIRGGHTVDGSSAGVFTFGDRTGGIGIHHSFPQSCIIPDHNLIF